MKIFIWNKDFLTDYTSGIAFVIADNEKEARKILIEKYDNNIGISNTILNQINNGPDEIHELKPSAFYLWGGS